MRKPIITVIAALAITVAGTAHAKPPAVDPGTISETVSYADLNLASPAGMETLTKRIERAADRVCRVGGHLLSSAEEFQSCREKARAGAMEQLNPEPLDGLSLANPFDGLELASIF